MAGGTTMMTLKQYNEWDGTFTMNERDEAEKAEKAMFKTMTEDEIDQYFDLCTKHVYALIDFGKTEERKTARALYKFCKEHNFSIEQAMMVY